MVVIGAGVLIMVGLLILTISEASLAPTYGVKALFFELSSAFGTTGLSLGVTPNLSTVGKIVLIITMFIGRIGILALLLMFKGDRSEPNIKYPEIDIIVG
jgi:Trk-type K+ transport system membrane component